MDGMFGGSGSASGSVSVDSSGSASASGSFGGSFGGSLSGSLSGSGSASLSIGGGGSSGMQLLPERNTLIANRFWIETNGVLDTWFSELSGMNIQTDLEEFYEGGNNVFKIKLPKKTSFTNIVLKHGMTNSTKYWDWYVKTLSGKPDLKTITIYQYPHTQGPDTNQTPLKSWEVRNAYPVKWTGPSFSAKSNEWVIEGIELAYEIFRLVP